MPQREMNQGREIIHLYMYMETMTIAVFVDWFVSKVVFFLKTLLHFCMHTRHCTSINAHIDSPLANGYGIVWDVIDNRKCYYQKSGKRSILWLRVGCQRLQEEFQVMRYKLASQIGYQKFSLATNRTFMAAKYIHAYLWSVNLKFPFFFLGSSSDEKKFWCIFFSSFVNARLIILH